MQIRVADIPETTTIFRYLDRKTGYEKARSSVHSRLGNRSKIELEYVDLDLERLKTCILDVVKEIGYRGWRHSGGEDQVYGGFSLTYNPDHQDGLDPHVSTIGTPKNERSEFFWNKIEKHEILKNSYFDTYGFRALTPAAKKGYLGELISEFKMPLIRSRVGIIPGENVNPDDKTYQENHGWHRDEPVFENLRINIPVQTDENYLFQMEGEEPYHLNLGTAYTWDTHKPHRVFAKGRTTTTRIHLVLGFSPWFDYDAATDAWSPNAYFGNLHPFDMLAEGIFNPRLRLPPKRLS
jgi:hypothetical protein